MIWGIRLDWQRPERGDERVKERFLKRDILSIHDFDRHEILFVLEESGKIKQDPKPKALEDKLLATCFYEPSTRTRLSLEAAMAKMGGKVTGFAEPGSSSAQKGESLTDAIRVIGQYVDAIAIRHPIEGAARVAAEATDVPVINCGDGANQHPTQTLLDLFTIQESHGTLDGISLAMVGDLRHGRTVHSLAQACALFDMRLYFVAPEPLEMPAAICDDLRHRGVRFSFHTDIEEVVNRIDILYMTRIQEERFEDPELGRRMRGRYTLTRESLAQAKEGLQLLHPLPRRGEIATEVDSMEQACYFKQALNGLYVRQALLGLILGGI